MNPGAQAFLAFSLARLFRQPIRQQQLTKGIYFSYTYYTPNAKTDHKQGQHHSDNGTDGSEKPEGPRSHSQNACRNVQWHRRQNRHAAQEKKNDIVIPHALETSIDPLNIRPGEVEVSVKF